MAHINLSDAPGILALFAFKPSLAIPLNALANELLRGPSPLTMGQRELIAAYVSRVNDTEFCYKSHAHVAAVHLGITFDMVDKMLTDVEMTPMDPLLKRLLLLARDVTEDSLNVSASRILQCKQEDATDEMIHDTIAIASAFCMYNRYVDGLDTALPGRIEDYQKMGKHLAENGYGVLPGQVYPSATPPTVSASDVAPPPDAELVEEQPRV